MDRIIIVGAGLVGTVLSVYLARRGYEVDVYERHPDSREGGCGGGRSINLTLCERGFRVLDCLGVGDEVRRLSVPVYGRMMHAPDGRLSFQPYGNNREAIYSIARADLNLALLRRAEREPNARFFFNEKCLALDLSETEIEFRNLRTGALTRRQAALIFGADGAYSAVRRQLQKTDRFNFSQAYWEQGYKELRIPAGAEAPWTKQTNVLHIWPRSNYMLILFPNLDGSFTCSLHLPYDGEHSFAALRTETDLLDFFRQSFPDALPHLPTLVEDFFSKPPSSMVTIRCAPWSHRARVALIGDAAHAIYPSYGQGANAGFEDCAVLDECLERHGADWPETLRDFEARRKPNTDAIADLCVEHFEELRDLVGDPRFLLRKDVERKVCHLYPDEYRPLYSMITFGCMSYAEARRRELEQRVLIDRIMSLGGIEDKLDSAEVEQSIHQLMAQRRAAQAGANGERREHAGRR